MSDQRSFSKTNETSALPPPLPVRKCSGNISGPDGEILPAKGGRGRRDGVPEIPSAPPSRRLPPEPRNESPKDFYLAPADSALPSEAVRKMVEDDGDDVVGVVYVDDNDFHATTTTRTTTRTTGIRATTQPLPPVPKGAYSSEPRPKPRAPAHSKGGQDGTRRAVALPPEEPKEGEEHDETTTSGGSQSSTWRSRSSPAIPSVPMPPVPVRNSSGANPVIRGKAIVADSNFNELEEVKKNLGKKPGRISSDRDEPPTAASRSKPPLPPARPSASETDKRPKPSLDPPSEKNTTNGLILTLEQQPWYHGELSRSDCEALIASGGQNGGFIVRRRCEDSDGFPYALSVLCNNRTHNIRIRRRPDKNFALGSEKPEESIFSDIVEMVNFHCNNPIRLNNNIQVKLSSGVPRR